MKYEYPKGYVLQPEVNIGRKTVNNYFGQTK